MFIIKSKTILSPLKPIFRVYRLAECAIVKLVFFIFLLSFSPILTIAQPKNIGPNDALLSQAQEQLDSLNYQKAIDLAKAIIKKTTQPSNDLSVAYSIQGDAYREQGQYEQAIEQYTRSKENSLLLPKQPSLLLAQANNDLGLCHWRKRDLTTAENYFTTALILRLQLLGEAHPKVADSYNNLGNIAFDKRDLNTARSFYEQALTIREKSLETDHIDIASSYMNLGSCYRLAGQFETAIDYYVNSLRIRKAKFGNLHPKVAQSCINLGQCYEEMEAIETAIEYYEQGIAIYQANEMSAHPDMATSYLGIGSCSSKLGDHQTALEFFQKSLTIQQTAFGTESANLISVYNNLANAYKYLGDYNQAMLFYENNIHLLSQSFGKQHPYIAATFNNIGLIQVELTQFDAALNSYHQALKIYQQQERYHRVAETWNNMGTALRQQEKFSEAIRAYQRSSSIFEQLYGANTVSNATVYYNIGNCLGEIENYEEAINYYQKAKALNKNTPSKLVEYATSIGTIYQKQNQLDVALVKYEEALQLLKINIQDATQLAYIQSPIEVINLLNAKAKTLLLKTKAAPTDALSLEILQHIDYATQVIAQLKQQSEEEYSKRKLSEITYETFEIGIAAATQLFTTTNDQQYLEKAFRYSEQSRSSLILEEKLSLRAAQIAQIPDSLLAKESQLKSRIAYYEKQKFASTDSILTVEEVNNQLFKQKQAYQQLIKQLEEQYPVYYRLKYKDALVPIETLQQALQPEEAVVEYFVSDTVIYTFLIRPQSVTLSTVVVDSLEEEVRLLRRGITMYYMDYDVQSEDGYRVLLIQYLRSAYFLYQTLIQPIAAQLPEKVTIINSSVLHYIPFDALVTDLPEGALHRLRDIDYLIRYHEINYASSATLFYNGRIAKPTKKRAKQILAFAPTFTFPNDLGLAPLSHNIKEVEQIQSLFPSAEIYTDSLASQTTFVQQANDFDILHLATHAKADDDRGDYSFLAFSNQGHNTSDRVLYAKDIYQLPLMARLVVLSACETGKGELAQGEGIVSLARAFIYSGAKSIVTTLWSINDATTKQFISAFYTHLKEGDTVGSSLRKAKLQYIEEADDPNPFFWAAFTLTGESIRLEETTTDSFSTSFLIFLAFVPFLLLLMYLFEKGVKV